MRAVWFVSSGGVSVVVIFTYSTTPNCAPLGDYVFNCMRPAGSAPGCDQNIPDGLLRPPMTVLQSASTTPEPMK
jgi:hypothetical protein